MDRSGSRFLMAFILGVIPSMEKLISRTGMVWKSAKSAILEKVKIRGPPINVCAGRSAKGRHFAKVGTMAREGRWPLHLKNERTRRCRRNREQCLPGKRTKLWANPFLRQL